MRILLLQLDGKLPNIALMRLAASFRKESNQVELRQVRHPNGVERGFWDDHDQVFASCIFTKTAPLARRLKTIRPDAVIGGTGWNMNASVEEYGAGISQDYSDYPAFRHSIGFTQRGCRMSCWFCVVPEKEGKVEPVATIQDIWRREPWPKEIILLDNDFFGQDCWRDRMDEIRAGGFKVSFNQGINARMLSDEAAAAIASVRYFDDNFKRPTIYTAWDNIGDERPLFRGLNALKRHGVKPDHITVYMLVGAGESEEDRLERHAKLREFGCRPYPMPYRRTQELLGFQRWIVRRADLKVSWQEYKRAKCRPERIGRTALPVLFSY